MFFVFIVKMRELFNCSMSEHRNCITRNSNIPFQYNHLFFRDLQSYLSRLTLFLVPKSKKFLILVDNRPWLDKLDARVTHLWQFMVTKVLPFLEFELFYLYRMPRPLRDYVSVSLSLRMLVLVPSSFAPPFRNNTHTFLGLCPETFITDRR